MTKLNDHEVIIGSKHCPACIELKAALVANKIDVDIITEDHPKWESYATSYDVEYIPVKINTKTGELCIPVVVDGQLEMKRCKLPPK